MSAELEYRISEVPSKGRWRELVQAERAKRELTRELHSVALIATEGVRENVAPSQHNWAYDIRRGQLRVYGSLLRCVDLLYKRGISIDVALMIPKWIEAYIRDIYGDHPQSGAIKPDITFDRSAA